MPLEWWEIPFVITSSPSFTTTTSLDKKETPKGYTSETFEFVKNNRETLQVQVAKGEGEALDTLASIYKNMNEHYITDIDKWKKTLQENYDEIFYRDGVVGDDEHIDYMLFNITRKGIEL
jgi:predicted transcriptional regulator